MNQLKSGQELLDLAEELSSAYEGGDRFSLADGESTIVRLLDELYPLSEESTLIVGANVHRIPDAPFYLVCPGEDECPFCQRGMRTSFKFWANLIDKGDKGKVKVLEKGWEVFKQLKEYAKEYGSLTDRDYKVRGTYKKRGAIAYTELTFIPLDKSPMTDKEKNSKRVNFSYYIRNPKLETLEKWAKKLSKDKPDIDEEIE